MDLGSIKALNNKRILYLKPLHATKAEPEMKKGNPKIPFFVLAEWTGLEPATPGVTGRYSNQLNYHS
jgi:hypothetical protein